MSIFDLLQQHDYGEIHIKVDRASSLRAIVAVHDTRLGPALGGCRFIDYASDEEAIVDALRLARGMTYKAALAGIAHGGGKSVIIRPRENFSRTAIFTEFGKFLEDLGGHYITAEDSGTSVEDMEVVRTVTKHVCGVSRTEGGSGDPSPFTALGVRRGIEACVKLSLGKESLRGIHVVVQGVGHVGYQLCKQLHEQGAKLTVADVDPFKSERADREFGATIVALDDVFDVECDVFSPCALGSAINADTIGRLRTKVVAGAANNQLANDGMAADLLRRDILYAPDYAINAGGLISVSEEYSGYDLDRVTARTMKIYDTIFEIADRARKVEMPTTIIANKMVEERLATAMN